MDMRFFGNTDRGCKRPANEDYFQLFDLMNLVVVCDGMGGHDSGDVASKMVAETVVDAFHRMTEKHMRMLSRHIREGIPQVVQRLYFCAQLANARLMQASQQSGAPKGMGTTLLAAHFYRKNIIVINVGDSRCYRIRDGNMECLTKDHSYAQSLYDQGDINREEFENFNQKNVIMRAIGMSPSIKMDMYVDTVDEGDIFLFCTDGLWGKVKQERILTRIRKSVGALEQIPNLLIQDAIREGGDDNITVVIAKNEKSGNQYNAIPPEKFTLSVTSPNEEKLVQSVLTKLFEPKRGRKWLLAVALFLLLLAAVGYLQFHREAQQAKKQESLMENESKKQTMPDSYKVYFMTNEPKWKTGTVSVDGADCGTLGELGNGHLFQTGKHRLELRVDAMVVYRGEFECLVDPTGQKNLVDIRSR